MWSSVRDEIAPRKLPITSLIHSYKRVGWKSSTRFCLELTTQITRLDEGVIPVSGEPSSEGCIPRPSSSGTTEGVMAVRVG